MQEEPSQVEPSASSSTEQDTANQVVKQKYGLVRRVLRAVFWSALLTFTTITILISALFSWLDSNSGRYWLVDAINRSGLAQVAAIDGSFWSEIKVTQLKIDIESLDLQLDYGVLQWEPYLLLLRDLSIPKVSLGRLQINTPPSPPDQPPSQAPKSLSLPLGIHLESLQVAELDINGLVVKDIAGSISSNGRFHRIHLNQLLLPQGKLAAALNITGKAPFHSAGSFIFAGTLDGQNLQTFGQVEGPLRDLNIDATIEHSKLKGSAQLQADLFAPYAYQMVRRGRVDVSGLNPQLWHPDAPQALIDIDADFKPTASGVDAQIKVLNHHLGPLDQKNYQSAKCCFNWRYKISSCICSRPKSNLATNLACVRRAWSIRGKCSFSSALSKLIPNSFGHCNLPDK
ncbi:hypothetical protein NT239_00585 [Chitinibacter sp. SCUT-21]|uniref:hypothetical protein n=1 Tax=Chitinibacter sp. SCUT-21 TaxID=2970891 RepID=UPI0035A6C7CE